MAHIKPFRAIRLFSQEQQATLFELFQQNALTPDFADGVYLYAQTPTSGENPDDTLGLFCLARLEEPETGVIVCPDIKECGEEISQIEALLEYCQPVAACAEYEDKNQLILTRLQHLQKTGRPIADFTDSAARHRFWVINDTVTIEALRKEFADKVLTIFAHPAGYRALLKKQKTNPMTENLLLALFSTKPAAKIPAGALVYLQEEEQ